jgi:hypothetical protein
MAVMDPKHNEQYMELLRRLVDRLERLSADSAYAHQASGLRGTFLRSIEELEAGSLVSQAELDQLVEYGFEILRQAAEEIGATR